MPHEGQMSTLRKFRRQSIFLKSLFDSTAYGMASIDLSSKRIVVTGGGGRLGSRMVEQFAQNGARVVALVITEEEAGRVPVGSAPEGVVTVKRLDITSEPSVESCFSEIGERIGSINALVHTVGMWSGSPLIETRLEDWDLIFQVNLTSTFLCFREAARLMQADGGTLIGISSRQGADRGVAQQAAYSATKAGVVKLVEAAAAEFAEDGIRCHSIAPSTILFDDNGEGVPAADIIELAAFLIARGASLNGATIRAYGS